MTKTKLLSAVLFSAILFGCTAKTETSPADDVYLYIGTINPKTRGATPVIRAPEGEIGLFPTFTHSSVRITDWYFSDKIYGFPLGVTGGVFQFADRGTIGNLMATTGRVKTDVVENASRYDHDHETATPYYYQVLLEDPEINTEFTVTANTVVFRFTLPANETSNLLLNFAGEGNVSIKDNQVIEGSSGSIAGRQGGGGAGASSGSKTYFYANLSKPYNSGGTWKDNTIAANSTTMTGTNSGFYVSYSVGASPETVELRIGMSRAGIDKARDFVTNEVGTLSFDQIKEKTKQLWNDELNVIKVKGGTEKQRQLFYTTLHRTRSLRMGNVWDTYRGAYPFWCLIRPADANKTIQGWLKTYQQTGWLPSSSAMIGHHSTAVIVDAYFRGVRDFDVQLAYEGMKKNHTQATMIPWKDAMYITELEQCYFDKGYFPSLPVRKDFQPANVWQRNEPGFKYERLPYQAPWLPETGVEEWVKEVDPWHRRQSVSVTLEHCYDDWCLAQIAKALGKEDDYQLFIKRAHNYQNLYKPELGLMAPKDADGNWIEPFDPIYSGSFAGEGYFAEGNSWKYTWHVQHDVQGLINLMGGREKFIDKLNQLFVTSHRNDKLQFLAQMPDMTGLVGMYSHGNEPCFHIPYLYNYAGQPWMTQNKVRQMMQMWYDTTPFGLSGDEDGGAMSAWYALSSIGLYSQCPGQPIWDIGSPIFEEAVIDVGNGKQFIIEAKNVSDQNKYIQSATLNGKTHNQAWIKHDDIIQGGKLVFQMGPRPNKSWASSPDVAPPSMSTPAR